MIGTNYILHSDASSEALCSVLSQIQDGQERVISYYSRSFTKHERNYCITRKELLSTVYTDHGALTWLLRFKNPVV